MSAISNKLVLLDQLEEILKSLLSGKIVNFEFAYICCYYLCKGQHFQEVSELYMSHVHRILNSIWYTEEKQNQYISFLNDIFCYYLRNNPGKKIASVTDLLHRELEPIANGELHKCSFEVVYRLIYNLCLRKKHSEVLQVYLELRKLYIQKRLHVSVSDSIDDCFMFALKTANQEVEVDLSKFYIKTHRTGFIFPLKEDPKELLEQTRNLILTGGYSAETVYRNIYIISHTSHRLDAIHLYLRCISLLKREKRNPEISILHDVFRHVF